MLGGMPMLSAKGLETRLHPILLKLSYGEVCTKLRVKDIRKLENVVVRDMA